MSLKQLEDQILQELKTVTGNSKLRKKDMMEWSTEKISPQPGETLHYLPNIKVWVCIKN